jgi:DNA mismatch repair ATPase MutS
VDRYNSLKNNARILDELDVALGFAELAEEMQLTRPIVDNRLVCDFLEVLALLNCVQS